MKPPFALASDCSCERIEESSALQLTILSIEVTPVVVDLIIQAVVASKHLSAARMILSKIPCVGWIYGTRQGANRHSCRYTYSMT